MFCNVCRQTPSGSKNIVDDCVIECLEKIKVHYNCKYPISQIH